MRRPSSSVPFNAPTIPGGVALAAGASPLANITGFVGEFNVNAIIRARKCCAYTS